MTEEHTVVTVRSVSIIAPICWLVSFVIRLAFLGLGGVAMLVLGSLCFSTPQPGYCEIIGNNGKIALITVGAILLCCCSRMPIYIIQRRVATPTTEATT